MAVGAEEEEMGYAQMLLDAQDKVVDLEQHLKDLEMCIQEQNAQGHSLAPDGQYRTSTPGVTTGIGGGQSRGLKVKLPELKLPIFEGEQSKWPEFWAIFESSIHDRLDQDMTPVQKFVYLKGQLKGEALNAVSGLLVTNDNYQIAVDILKDRYGNTEALKRQLLKKLRELAPCGMKPRELRSTMDEQNKLLRQLESLGENLQHVERIPLILEKYPLNFLKEVNRLKDPGVTLEAVGVETLMNYLQQAVKDHENLADLARTPTFKDKDKSQDGKRKKQYKSSGEEIVSSVDAMATEVKDKRSGGKKGGLKASSDGARKWQLSCAFCEKQHYSDSCQTVKTPEERQQLLIKKRLCYNCLRPGHMKSKCRAMIKSCWHCKGSHNTAMCKDKKQATQNLSTSVGAEEIEVVTSNTANIQEKDAACLMIKEVRLSNPLDPTMVVKTHMLFDNGSQRSFITENLQKKLNLKVKKNGALTVCTLTSEEEMKSPQTELSLHTESNKKLKMQVNVLKKLTNQTKMVKLTEVDKRSLPVSEVVAGRRDQVIPQLLIGADYASEILKNEAIVKLPSGLVMLPSVIGPLIGGKQKSDEMTSSLTTTVDKCVNLKVECQSTTIKKKTVKKEASTVNEKNESSSTDDENLDFMLEKFFKLESIGIMDDATVNDDDRALAKFNQSVKLENQRYQVEFPWKDRHPNLPTNYGLALGRLMSLSRKLKEDKSLLDRYNKFLQDQEDQEMIEKVDPVKPIGPRLHYLAHHPVINEHKTTTKLRVVYDASARSQKHSPTLNECMLRGGVFLNDLCGILMRIQLPKLLVLSDVKSAFLQLVLQEQDRDATRFLWFKDKGNPDVTEENIQEYRFARVPFGIIASPFLLGATLQYHLAKDNSEVSQKILENLYVDNVIIAAKDKEEAEHAYKEANRMFGEASMQLRQWACSDKAVHEKFQDREEGPDIKIMGLKWNKDTDKLAIAMPGMTSVDRKLSKRAVVQMVAKLYDPLGLLSPVLLPFKLFIQSLWKKKLKWDEELSPELKEQWDTLTEEHREKDEFEFPRLFTEDVDKKELSLHAFVDASGDAYGTCVFICAKDRNQNESDVKLLFSKVKVMPKMKLTMPRAELMAALVGVRALNFVTKQLHKPIKKRVLWSDSQCVLKWMKTEKLLSVFVRNRINEIQKQDDVEFRYINTKENPADLASRGCKMSTLKSSRLWWTGPEWLTKDPSEWPMWSPMAKETDAEAEKEFLKKKTNDVLSLAVGVMKAETKEPVIDWSRFSKMSKLLKTTVYILRFVKKDKRETVAAEAAEIRGAKRRVLKMAQEEFAESNAEEFSKLQQQLGLAVDQEGLYRCQGRLLNVKNAETNFQPIFLPANHPVTKLMVMWYHEKSFHNGWAHTLAAVRKKFWIHKGKSVVKKILKSCMVCRKHLATPFESRPMPALPPSRVQEARPFKNIGVDYLGPVIVKFGDQKTKVWVCLFTCMTIRAIHLEIAYDLSANQFINCLRRFIAIYGCPTNITSDNGTNFRAASEFCAMEGIKWKFNTPSAPWEGGFFERMVGLVKKSFKMAVGRALLSVDQLQTLLAEIAATVNSRPLTYLDDEVSSQRILRPIDFLQPPDEEVRKHEMEPVTATDETSKTGQNLSATWQANQSQINKFWRLWNEDYLHSLREIPLKHKKVWSTSKLQPKKGQVVLVEEKNQPRNKWKIGIIASTVESADGEVRRAEIRLPNQSVLRRPVTQLYPLEDSLIKENHMDQTGETNDDKMEQKVSEDKEDEVSRTETADESDAKDAEKTKDEASNLRRSERLKQKKQQTFSPNTMNWTAVLMLLLLMMPMAMSGHKKGRKCPDHQDPDLRLVYSPACVSSAQLVLEKNGVFCWLGIHCGSDKELDSSGHCGPKCSCPSWTQGCSHSMDNETPKNLKLSDEHTEILESIKAEICSMEPKVSCKKEPTHEKKLKIQVEDGSRHWVNTPLQLQHKQVFGTVVECVGEGATATGTSDFCETHHCDNSANRFCFRRSREVIELVTENGNLPIRAFGFAQIKYYDYEGQEQERDDQECHSCQVKCTQAGIKLRTDHHINLVGLYVKPFRFQLNKPFPEEFSLPAETIIKDYEVSVKFWAKGLLIKEQKMQCHGHPFCEQIQCTLCFQFINNPHCAPKLMWSFVAIGIFCVTLSLHVTMKILKTLLTGVWKITRFLLRVTLFTTRCCQWCCTKLFKRRGRQTRKRRTILRSESEDGIEDEVEMSVTVSETGQRRVKIEPGRNDKIGVQRKMKRQGTVEKYPWIYSKKSTLMLLTLLMGITTTEACSEASILTASRSACSLDKNGITTCAMKETTRVNLVPHGQDTCLLMQEASGEPLGTIAIEVKDINLVCQYHSKFWTRDINMEVQSSKRCSGAGSCYGLKCGQVVNTEFKIKELMEANKWPGFTYCSASCGCAGCGCFYCTSACLFWRTYVESRSQKIYEIFECPVWNFNVEIVVRIQRMNDVEQKTFQLQPGKSVKWKQLKMSLLAISNPPVPILSKTFITDGKKTAMVATADEGQPVAGKIGNFQCKNEEDAKKLKCKLAKDACKCQERETSVSCQCDDVNIEEVFEDMEKLLPIETEGIMLESSGNRLTASYQGIASMGLQMSLEGMKLSAKVDKNMCTVEPIQLTGCYGCISGAKLTLECETDKGDAIAHVTCETVRFAVKCTTNPEKTNVTLVFAESQINEKCTVQCPAGNSEFELKGQLTYVGAREITHVKNIVTVANKAETADMDWLDLGKWFSVQWLKTSVVVVFAIVVSLVLIVGLGPCMMSMAWSMYDQCARKKKIS